MTQIVDLSADALSQAIHRRDVSCVEVMTSYLDHIDVVNPHVNAIVSMAPRETLLAQATERDAELTAGRSRGWMHGMPHAAKDLVDAQGFPTTQGFHRPPFEAPVATADTPFVGRIRAAGAIVIGKTNVPSFGLGSHTHNEVFGPTRNPFDLGRSAGGSSGGAAAGLAARMLPVADGSDFFGSLRNPAGWNSVLGFRPTIGCLPAAPERSFAARAGTDGPMARTATDLAHLLDVMTGRSEYAVDLERDFRGVRVAWFGDLGGYLPTEPGVLDLCRRGLSSFSAMGAVLETVDELPSGPGFAGIEDLWRTWLPLRHSLIGGALLELDEDPVLREHLSPEARYEIEGLTVGADGLPPLSALDVIRGGQRRAAMTAAFAPFFDRYEFAVLPTAQVFPFPVEQRWPAEIAGRPMSAYHRWMETTSVATLLGCPAIALPVGVDERGLPMGVQVLARHGAERSLLQLARAWEQVEDRVELHRPAHPSVV